MRLGALEAGGTKMVCAIGNENGEIFERVSIPTETPEITLPKLIDYFKDKEIEADIKKVFKRFPILDERSYQLGGTLSGGQQQMLAIGRALMARPKLLLLDEPSMGLAPLVVNEIFETIKEISAEGTTVLLVEQNVRQALKIADYAYVLETGKMVLSGPADEVRHDPRVMEAYLGGRVE